MLKIILFILFILLQTGDTVTTLIGIKWGCVEKNPLIRFLMGTFVGHYSLILYKIALVLLMLLAFRYVPWYVLLIVNLIYIYVVIHNCIILHYS
jgi:uncharacterized membrane protein